MKTPMQQLLDLLAEADLMKPPPVEVPQKFIDEMNQFGEIRSEREFLDLVQGQLIGGKEQVCRT